MAALKQLCASYKDEFALGIAWVAVWKNGRSWNVEAFWAEDGGYDDGYEFLPEDMERMQEIIKEDHKAVMLNGYFTNCGVHEDGNVSISDLVAGVEWNYYNGYNRLHGFYDSMVIQW